MRLRELRKEKGISQLKLALDLNINQNTISRYESGLREADYQTLIKIADYFNVSIDYLLNRTEYVYPLSLLDEKMVENYTYSGMMNTVIQLSSASRTDLVNYIEMLRLRERTQKANNTLPQKTKK